MRERHRAIYYSYTEDNTKDKRHQYVRKGVFLVMCQLHIFSFAPGGIRGLGSDDLPPAARRTLVCRSAPTRSCPSNPVYVYLPLLYLIRPVISILHPEGFEPPTLWTGTTRSIQLSYGCM